MGLGKIFELLSIFSLGPCSLIKLHSQLLLYELSLSDTCYVCELEIIRGRKRVGRVQPQSRWIWFPLVSKCKRLHVLDS